MPWAVAAAVVGGVASNAAAGKAAKAQGKAADQATELQREQYNQTREDNLPWMQRGNAAGTRLNTLLGLSTGATTLADGKKPLTAEEIRLELRDQYLRGGGPGVTGQNPTGSGWTPEGGANLGGSMNDTYTGQNTMATNSQAGAGGYNDADLEAAVQARMATQNAELAAAQGAGSDDPQYGMLTRQFTGADLENEPGYKFGLQQGTESLNNSLASRGGIYSGAAGKALQRFGQDYAGSKFGEAWNRDASEKNRLFNMFSGVAGTGQTANNQVQSAGQVFAGNAGNNIMGAANARGSSYIAGSNALQSAVNGGVAAWNNKQPAVQPMVYDGGYSVGQGAAYGGNRAGM
jgi:hypothetical protein